jgi:glycine cleavage system transcriptional repressor
MRTSVVITLSGPDRVGIVEEVTGVLLGLGGNVEMSRMARLGGEFTVLMLVSMPVDAVDVVESAFGALVARGYAVTVRQTETPGSQAGLGFRIDVQGADHEGIIHEIAAGLSTRGINIESMETWTARAPVTGAPLFMMTALVAVPASLSGSDWIEAVRDAAEQANVDIDVVAVDAQ